MVTFVRGEKGKSFRAYRLFLPVHNIFNLSYSLWTFNGGKWSGEIPDPYKLGISAPIRMKQKRIINPVEVYDPTRR